MTVVQSKSCGGLPYGFISEEEFMRVRDKEHQSLGIKELKQLTFDFPNDAELGGKIREIVREDPTYVRPRNIHPEPTKGG